MASTFVTALGCNRGFVTTILNNIAGNTTYIVENNDWEPSRVQYWGTLFQIIDDTTEVLFPYEVFSTELLFRSAYRITTTGLGGVFVGRLELWIPANYRDPQADIRVYRY